MDTGVEEKFNSYPVAVCDRLMKIRGLIFDVSKAEFLGEITETLKWGEPSYSSKQGSPIRIDWKQKEPSRVSIFFNCKTTLIETFREIYSDSFQFVGNREIILPMSKPIPTLELKDCISMALRYHNIKHLPLLGA